MVEPQPALLEGHLAAERSVAVRTLLAAPLLDVDADPDGFRLVARHAGWLADWFERVCGWTLTVDAASGYARLAKRAVEVDVTRPLTRTRGERSAFDARRYQLLCLVCAELVRHPMTTVGLLAAAVTAEAGLDTRRHGERAAFVDSLRALMAWGALRVSAGEIDAFVESEGANALLTAETSRLHRLLVNATAASSLPADLDVEEATRRLLAEPRYGDADDPDRGDGRDEARHRSARHRLGRRLLDDPAVHLDDLSTVERDYLSTSSGRVWLRDRVAEAGFELEERADGLLAVDPDAVATDSRFPAPLGNAHQLALLLIDRLVTTDGDGRQLGRLDPVELRTAVDAVLERFPGWARSHRDPEGAERLAREAVDLLVSFGLARREPDGTVIARPAAARYRPADPVVTRAASLFEEIPT